MSAGTPDPSWQLPLPPDSAPERRRVKPAHLLLGTLLALVLLCCGGAAGIEALTGGNSDKSDNSATQAVPGSDPATPAVTETVTTSPAPAATPESARPRRTTHKPATEPPTTRPTTKSPAPTPTTTGPALPVVRAGSLCAPVGAFGITAQGKVVRCVRQSEDERPRWRFVRSEGRGL